MDIFDQATQQHRSFSIDRWPSAPNTTPTTIPGVESTPSAHNSSQRSSPLSFDATANWEVSSLFDQPIALTKTWPMLSTSEPYNLKVVLAGQPSEDWSDLGGTLRRLYCGVTIARSETQTIAWVKQLQPALVILAMAYAVEQNPLTAHLRKLQSRHAIAVLGLAEGYSHHHHQHKLHPELDGLLVKPIASEILHSVIESLWVRYHYCRCGGSAGH